MRRRGAMAYLGALLLGALGAACSRFPWQRVVPNQEPPDEFMCGRWVGYWRANERSIGDTYTDLSGNGRNLAATAVTVGTTLATDGWGVSGLDLASLNGSTSQLDTGSKAPWVPLHDGTGASVFMVLRPTGTGADQYIMSSTNSSTADTGFMVWYDGVDERIVLYVVNGNSSASPPPQTLWTWRGSVPRGKPAQILVEWSDARGVKLWVNGRIEAEAKTGHNYRDGEGVAFATGNPSRDMVFGSLSPSGNHLTADLAEWGVLEGHPTKQERERLFAFASNYYGLGVQGHRPGMVFFDGNSQMADYYRTYKTWPYNVADGLTHRSYCLNRGTLSLRSYEAIDRASVHVDPYLIESLASRPFTVYVPWEIVNHMADGVDRQVAYDKFVELCQRQRALGCKVVVFPNPPWTHATINETDWNWLNDQMLANWATFADAIARNDQDPWIGDWANRAEIVVPSDGVHLNEAACAVLVPYVVDAINSVLP